MVNAHGTALGGRWNEISGDAPQQWLETARRLTRALPGVTRLDESGLLTAEAREQQQLKDELGFAALYFNTGTAQFASGQAAALQKLLPRIQRLFALAASTGKQPQLEITGHTDAEGSAEFNQRLSETRAKHVLDALAAKGIDRAHLRASGAATKFPLRSEQSKEDKQLNRRVSFQITWQH